MHQRPPAQLPGTGLTTPEPNKSHAEDCWLTDTLASLRRGGTASGRSERSKRFVHYATEKCTTRATTKKGPGMLGFEEVKSAGGSRLKPSKILKICEFNSLRYVGIDFFFQFPGPWGQSRPTFPKRMVNGRSLMARQLRLFVIEAQKHDRKQPL